MTIAKNFAGIVAFMKVAATGSFNEAARELGISAPAVSKSVGRLEAQLNVRLLDRTTHHVAITPEGKRFFEECLPSVDHLMHAAQELKDSTGEASGRLRISSTVGFGRRCIAPLLPAFCAAHPDIRLEFDLNDRFVDFAGNGVDVAIRNGRLDDADIVARKLAPMRLIVCGSPEYLRQAGQPTTLDDLSNHRIVAFRLEATGKPHDWEFNVDGTFVKRAMRGHEVFNDPEMVAAAAVAGGGLAQLANYQADALIADGSLLPVLTGFIAEGRGHFVCYRSRKQTPMRIRAFVEYLLAAFEGGLPEPANTKG